MTNTIQTSKFTIATLLLIAGFVVPSISFAQYYNYGNLSGSCSTNISNPIVGNNVNWSGYAVGGNGVYTYSWSDNEGLNSVGQYVSKYYSTAGQKNVTLTITSNGQSITRYCSVYVLGTTINNPVYNPYIPPVYNPTVPTAPIQNQVLGSNTQGTTLAAVYLSDVPYTGFEDVFVPILFMLAVLSWSMYLAYRFTKQGIQA